VIAVMVPFRPHGTRNRLWEFTRNWIADHYDYPVFTADTPNRAFNRGMARNNAARAAGDWDVGIFHDADTIAHPEAIEEAIDMAVATGKMVVAGDCFTYLSKGTTERILSTGDVGFVSAERYDEDGVYARPCSGVVVVTRKLFDAVGGYIESFRGWGYEDLIFLTSCGIFGNGNTWVPHYGLLHLWHERAERDADTENNRMLWEHLVRIKDSGDRDGAIAWLRSQGHRPGGMP